jgi:hypothetical protein
MNKKSLKKWQIKALFIIFFCFFPLHNSEALRYCSVKPPEKITEYFAPAINLFSNNEPVIRAYCRQNKIKIHVKGRSNTMINRRGYLYEDGRWERISFRGEGKQNWIKAHATAELTVEPERKSKYIFAHICHWQDDEWKCGCRDRGCLDEPRWTVSAFRNPKIIRRGGGKRSRVIDNNDNQQDDDEQKQVEEIPERKVVYALNAGGGSYAAFDGTIFESDSAYATGGNTYSNNAAITGSQDITLYQTERYGTYSYELPVLNQKYDVTFKFAEIFHEATEGRVFDVQVEGVTVIDDLDIFAEVGHDAAYDVVVENIDVTDGALSISMVSDVDSPKLSALLVNTFGDTVDPLADDGTIVYVDDFGGDGTDMNDDSAAILSAITFAEDNGHKTVVFGDGSYYYSDGFIIDGITVTGASDTTLIATEITDFNVDGQNQYKYIELQGIGSAIKNVSITTDLPDNDTRDRRGTLEKTGIRVNGAVDFEITDVNIWDSTAVGLYIHGGFNGYIANNIVMSTESDGIHIVKLSRNIVVENNWVQGTRDDGIAVVSYQNHGGLVSDIIIRNNVVLDNEWGRGISVVGGEEITIENNFVSDHRTGGAGIYLIAENAFNTFGVYNTTVTKNIVQTTGGFDVGHGGFHIGAGSADVQNLQVSDNVILASRKNGMVLTGGQPLDASINDNLFIGQHQSSIVTPATDFVGTIEYNDMYDEQVGDGYNDYRIAEPLNGDIPNQLLLNLYGHVDPTYDSSPEGIQPDVSVSDGDLTPHTVFGDDSEDDLSLPGVQSDGLVSGLAGDDVITGGNGDDILFGGKGDDMITVSKGSDSIIGGLGSDTFIVTSTDLDAEVDHIKDFSIEEVDVLDISDVLPEYDPASYDLTDFLQITDDGTDSSVFVDLDGGGDDFVQILVLENIADLSDVNEIVDYGRLIVDENTPIDPPDSDAIKAINIGGSAYTALDGTVYEADTLGVGTVSSIGDSVNIAATLDDVLYRKASWGALSYAFDVENGDYRVELAFADIFHGTTDPGDRVFDISIENELLVDDYDIVADVGHRTATTKSFDVTIADGQLNIDLTHEINNPKLSVIRIYFLAPAG